MKKFSLKRALNTGIFRGTGGKGNNNNLLLWVGGAALLMLGASFVMGKQTAAAPAAPASAAMFAGDSSVGAYPIAGFKDPRGNPHIAVGKRSFADYTMTENALPTPFLEINFPYDNVKNGARLANIVDKCAYVQTYTGWRD